jgi:ABC-2 type transport system ATP-binding protein
MPAASGTLSVRSETGQPRVGSKPDFAVRAVGLTKLYRNPWTLKNTVGLEDLTLDVRRGEVLGYLGPNGAGKTTTLKLLTGLLKPTLGQAWLMGESIEDPRSRRHLGFLPEQPYFYDYLNGLEYLEMAGRLCGLSGQDATQQAARWLGRVGLDERPRLRLRKYSKGMLQRLGLAAALVHRPELLILDEPMSGLDPFGRRDVRDLILEQKANGVSVMFSSHILPDVELLCDRVAIVLKGRLARVAEVDELLRGPQQRVEIACRQLAQIEIPARWREVLRLEARGPGALMVLDHADLLNEVLRWLLASGAQVTSVTPHRSSLEALFLSASDGLSEFEGERRLA